MVRFDVRAAAIAFVCAALPGPAAAQDLDRSGGRYAFVPGPEGTLRLDTRTGAVSLCSGDGAALACRPVREDDGTAAALRDVEARLAAIEDKLARIEAERGTDAGEETETGLPTLKDEEAVDRVMDLAERMMRRFFDMVEEFREETEPQRI